MGCRAFPEWEKGFEMFRMGSNAGRKTSLAIAAALAAGVLCAASNASAALLLPGGAAFAPAEPDPVGGIVVASTGPVPFATGSFTGVAISEVIAGDPANPFGPGFLTFTYRVVNTDADATPTNIVRVTMSEFDAFLTDVSYLPAAFPSVAPTSVERDALGDVIGYNYTNPPLGLGQIAPGRDSSLLVVQTNAPAFRPGLLSVINGTTATVGSFAPIPEPAALGLLGVAGLALVRRRR